MVRRYCLDQHTLRLVQEMFQEDTLTCMTRLGSSKVQKANPVSEHRLMHRQATSADRVPATRGEKALKQSHPE